MTYDCTINGQCKPSPAGRYSSLSECQRECQGTDNADLLYLMLSYDWGLASTFSLSDQQELLRREFKMRVTLREAEEIVYRLREGNVLELLKTSEIFADYLEPTLTDFDIFVLEVIEILAPDRYVDWLTVKNAVRGWLTLNLANFVYVGDWTDEAEQGLLANAFGMMVMNLPLGRFYGMESLDRLHDLFLGRFPWLVEEFRES